MNPRSPWHAAVAVPASERGFDDPGPHWLHPDTWDEPNVSGAVAAILSAVASDAGWAALFQFDPAQERDRVILGAVCDDIEAGLLALRAGLHHETTHEPHHRIGGPMAVTTEPENIDLDALEADCKSNISNLRAAIGRLALDALHNPAAREELTDCEHQLDEAEAELGRLALARAERERRDIEQHTEQERARRAAAFARARELQGERQKAARSVDRAAARFVEAVAEFVDVARRQESEFAAAGMLAARDAARPKGFVLEAAFAHALRSSGADFVGLGLWDRLPAVGAHAKALADADVDLAGWVLPAENK